MDGFIQFLQQILSFTGSFNIHLVVLLFIICSVGEFSFSVPYLLETLWLLTGYNLGAGNFSPHEVLLLWLTAQAGRQTGGMVLYLLSRLGSMPLIKLYNRYFEAGVSKKLAGNTSPPFRFIRQINYLSPFSIAMGRLFWLRIPITMTLAVKRKPNILSLGIVISSLVWDNVYIGVGLIGASATLKPLQMVLYSLAGLTTLYGITFAIRHIPRRSNGRNARPVTADSPGSSDTQPFIKQ